MADRKATLTVDGLDKAVELPIYSGTLGPDVIDVRSLGAEGLFTYDPGFMVTSSCQSAITYIDGGKGVLLHRGYPIDQLAKESNFVEVCYTLLFGARIKVAVYAVPKAHQLEGIVFIFCLIDETLNVFFGVVADFVEHVQYGFVGAAVSRAPQSGDACADASEWVSTGRTCQANRRRGSILLMIRVQRKDAVHGFRINRIHLVLFTWVTEHHVKEVFSVSQVVTWIVERLSNIVLMRHRCNGRHFGYQANRADNAVFFFVRVHVIVIERRQAAYHAA